MLFSATFSKEIRKLAQSLLRHPLEITVEANKTVRKVEQFYTLIDHKQKSQLLKTMIIQNKWQQVLVFTRTKHGANRLTQKLEAAKIKDVMESAVDLEVPNKVDYESGPNWGEIK